MSSIGVDIPVNYRKNNVSMGIGINYQYNFSNYLRGEFVGGFTPIHSSNSSSSVGYDYNSDKVGTVMTESAYVNWQAFLNAHFFLFSPKRVRPYVITGCGIQSYKIHNWAIYSEKYKSARTNYTYSDVEDSHTSRAFVLNLGLGMDIRLNYRWTMQIAALALTAFDQASFENARFYDLRSKSHDFTMEATARVGINYNF